MLCIYLCGKSNLNKLTGWKIGKLDSMEIFFKCSFATEQKQYNNNSCGAYFCPTITINWLRSFSQNKTGHRNSFSYHIAVKQKPITPISKIKFRVWVVYRISFFGIQEKIIIIIMWIIDIRKMRENEFRVQQSFSRTGKCCVAHVFKYT